MYADIVLSFIICVCCVIYSMLCFVKTENNPVLIVLGYAAADTIILMMPFLSLFMHMFVAWCADVR